MAEDFINLQSIKEEVFDRAERFALQYDEAALKSNDIRMKAPMLFVLLGDGVREGTYKLQEAVRRNMSNGEGMVYFTVASQEEEEDRSKEVGGMQGENINKEKASQIIEFILPKKFQTEDKGTLNKLLMEDEFLKELNEKVDFLAQCILEKNKVFSYWEQMHVTVITTASDEMNAIMPDLVVLIKNKLEQSFKQVFTDLFVLLEETGADATPIQKALSYSLFKELDLYQSSTYHYEKEIEYLDEGMKLMTTYDGQLFHLVYLLTDKKENGQRINEARKMQYESIVAVNLLKNREQKSVELEEAREQFNYNTFISNVQEMTENRYCTARLAKVRKPGQGIYLAVVYHLFKAYERELSYEGQDASKALMDRIGLCDEKIEALVRECLPGEEALDEIHSLISRNIAFKELKNETFTEAESNLYGTTAREFFNLNFKESAEKKIQVRLSKECISERLIEEVVSQREYGPFALEQLFKSEAYSQLEHQKDKYLYQMKQAADEVEERENQLVGQLVGGNFGLFDKKYVHEVKDYLIHKVYSARYQYEVERLKDCALKLLKEGVETFNQNLRLKLKKLRRIEAFLSQCIEEANRYEEEYLVQNVMDYYERVVEEKLDELRQSKGEHFLHDEKHMGPSYSMLEQSEDVILKKLFSIAEQEVLRDERYFNVSFEEELLARANMLVEYEDTQVAAKGELYKLLYESLEENSKPCVHLDTTLSPHRYLEKYFFGNRQSEFIEYAYKRDQSSRSYKIGTVSDQRKSVIEKLQLMGGFRLQDLVYSRSAQRYYEAYKEKGYVFHADEIKALLERGE